MQSDVAGDQVAALFDGWAVNLTLVLSLTRYDSASA
jgi:hypothetical protein